MQHWELIEKGIARLFEERAELSPDKSALLYEGGVITYAALNARANQIASFLQRKGVTRERRVAVLLPRSPRIVEALLGVLKAGGAYAVFDPRNSDESLGGLLDELESPLILTELASEGRLKQYPVQRICIDDPKVDQECVDDIRLDFWPEQLASIVYTSGSTGKPKGVLVPMRAIMNRLAMMWSEYPHLPDDVVLIHRSCAIIGSSWDLFGPLLHGAPGVVLSAAEAADPLQIWDAVVKHNVSHVAAAPPVWQWLVERAEARPYEWTSLRLGIIGGDATRASLVERWRRSFPQAILLNVYGATECVTPLAGDLTKIERCNDPAPIGTPAPNVDAYVLDSKLEKPGVGESGELYIAGPCLSRGYLNQAAMTADRFLPNPHASHAGDVMFRTGDLAKPRTDGQLDLIGRTDHQIKVRGFKVDLCELEGEIERRAGVRRAVVVPYADRQGQTSLIAYLERTTDLLPAHRLRASLLKSVPAYMVPSQFCVVDRLPLTANGKVDRQALLPAIVESASSALDSSIEATETERLLFEIWSETLDRAPDHLDANFFDLGGHSLTAMQVVSRIEERIGLRINLGAIFDNPTIRLLAKTFQWENTEAAPSSSMGALATAECVGSKERAISFNQEGRLYADYLAERVGKTPRPNHVVLQLRLRGPVNHDALRAALSEIVQRHEVLRTGFGAESTAGNSRAGFGARPIISSDGSIDLQLIDFTHLSTSAQYSRLRERFIEETTRPFDRRVAPLMRPLLFHLKADDHVLLVIFDHLISDGYSLQLFRRELEMLYANALGVGRDLPPATGARYEDFAAWQRRRLTGKALSDLIHHWKSEWSAWRNDMLSTEALPGLGTARSRTSPHLWADTVTLSESATAAVKEFANRNAVTLYMMCLAAMCVMLRALTDRARVGVLAHYANRHVPEFDDVLGWFANSHPLGIDFSSDPTLAQVVSRMREEVIRGNQHQELPFPLLLQEMLKTDPKNPAFSPTLVSIDFRRESETRIGELLITPAIFRGTPSPLQLIGIERPRRLTLLARCTMGSCDAIGMRRMLTFSREVLMMIVANPSLRVSSCLKMAPQRPEAALTRL